jgi:hypothetical protein
MQRIVAKLRLLVGRRLANQDIARANAADASATLRERRHEQEDVDTYLRARRLIDATEGTGRRQGDGAERAV